MTREERLEIYKEMLYYAVKDLKASVNKGYPLYGFCQMIFRLTLNQNSIDEFPELINYKPFDCVGVYWFDTDPNGPDATKRINILKEIINTMTNEKTKKYQNP